MPDKSTDMPEEDAPIADVASAPDSNAGHDTGAAGADADAKVDWRGRHSKQASHAGDDDAEDAADGMGEHSKKGSVLHEAFEFVMMIAIALVLVFGVQRFLVQPYRIPSGSMEPTIEIGELILSEKVSYYSRTPIAGEIVTFTSPMDSSETLIKRVIATAGQTVDLKDGYVYVDGVQLDEEYTHGKVSEPFDKTMEGVTISYPYTVPEGCVWVMGDNRTNSEDSRYFGAVQTSTISGHACCAYWPIDRIGPLN